MNDVVLDVLMTTDRYTVSVLRGNAGAGGAFLTLAMVDPTDLEVIENIRFFPCAASRFTSLRASLT